MQNNGVPSGGGTLANKPTTKNINTHARSLLIIERDLIVLSGHQHTQIERITSLVPDQNVFVITTEDFALGDTLDTDNIFAILPGRKARSSREVLSKSAEIIRSKLASLSLTAKDQIAVPSCRSSLLKTLLLVYQSEPQNCPISKIRILSPDVLERLTAAELGTLRELTVLGKILILTETAELALHIRTKHLLDCTDRFLLPASIPLDGVDRVDPKHRDANHFKIGCLGQARRGKGSFDIPKIVDALRKVLVSRDQAISITIYVQKPVGKILRTILFNWQDYKSRNIYPNVNIHVLPSTLPPSDFRKLMGELDLLLLPYWPSRYGQRGSGMVTDGVLARKPIVYTQGLSMQRFLNHGNAESANTAHEFSAKIIKVCEDLDSYNRGALKASKYFAKCVAETQRLLEE